MTTVNPSVINVTISNVGPQGPQGPAGASGVSRSVNNISANTPAGNAANTDYVYYCTGTLSLTLPSPTGNTSNYKVVNVGTGVVTVTGTGLTYTIPTQGASEDFQSNGSTWYPV